MGAQPSFAQGIKRIRKLANDARYEAAFVFGSVAEGTSTDKSDLDVRVIVDDDSSCESVNHPMFDDYKLDVTFCSYKQIGRSRGRNYGRQAADS